MYVLTIVNNITNRYETKVYDDATFDPERVLTSFTNEVLTSIVQAYFGESAQPNKKTFEDCGRLWEYMADESHFAENAVSFLTTVDEAPKTVMRKLKEIHRAQGEEDFDQDGDEFYSDGCANVGSIIDYLINWVIYDDGEFNYQMGFESREGYIYIDIEHKDTYDTLD